MDLFSDAARRDPFPLYAAARAAMPVLRVPGHGAGLWLALDYESVKRVLSDHEAFSSSSGVPEGMMIFTDPPRHGKLRALVSRAFTPRSIAALEPRIRGLCRELLDAVAGQAEVDVAADLAVPLPVRVIAAMLGVPAADQPRFLRWNDALLEMGRTIPGGDGSAGAYAGLDAATDEIEGYLADQLARRAIEPADDLLTRLAAAEVDGERLTRREIVGFFQLLLLAGSETTTNLLNNAILCFTAHPDQLAVVRERPDLLPAAIEEVLRYRSPLQWMFRFATREVEIGRERIPAGAMVLAVMGSANRDPAAFPDPDRFDVTRFASDREATPHLAFGHGAHFCLGAALARLEARVALEAFLARYPTFARSTAEPWQPRPGLHVHGPVRLVVRVGTG